ncbi:CBS domain-containing protein [Candidatus Woesearchaeota archaeon]|nr:CBS domain-containing protein [Candidatus Woesearchaeota archaeon]
MTSIIKSLMARVSKIMLTDVPILKKEAKIEEAGKLLVQNQVGCVMIVEDKNPIGIVTELDFVRTAVSKGKSLKEPVSRIMSSPLTLMTPNMKLDEALKIIDTKKFRKYPVVENGALVGLATKKDVVNAISDNLRFHRNIQNAVLILFILFELFVFVIGRYIP